MGKLHVLLTAAVIVASCTWLRCQDAATNPPDPIAETCLCATPSTDPAVSLQVIAPQGGEVYHTGDTLKVRLCYDDTTQMIGGEEVHLELSPGARGQVLKVLFADEITESELELLKSGRFNWKIPRWIYHTISGVTDSVEVRCDSCRIRFQGYEGMGATDNFDYSGYFSIR